MKRNVKCAVVMAAALIAAGCEDRDLSERYRIEDHSTTAADSADAVSYVRDTILRYVAVEANLGYDWRRDTLAGAFKGTLTMYRNGNPEISLQIGPKNEISPDFGTHFIIGGRLFTYYSTESLSVVKCNGRDVMRSSEREALKGLLPTAEGVITLSETAAGGEFIVRRDGAEVMRFEADAVFGSMEDDSYPLSGAVYQDYGSQDYYFCYRSTVAGDTAYYIVENLKTRVLAPPVDLDVYDIKDIKMDRGNVNYFAIHNNTYACMIRNDNLEQFSGTSGKEVYFDGRVLPNRETTIAIGNYSKPQRSNGRTLFFTPGLDKDRSFPCDGFIIPGTGSAHCIYYLKRGEFLLVYSNSGGGPAAGSGCHCFSRRSTSCIGNCVYLAFTPKQEGEKPYIWKSDGDTTRVKIRNGYLTSLVAVDTVTTTRAGFRQD